MKCKDTTYRIDNVECHFYRDKQSNLFVEITIEEDSRTIKHTLDGKTWNSLRAILSLIQARESKNLLPYQIGI